MLEENTKKQADKNTALNKVNIKNNNYDIKSNKSQIKKDNASTSIITKKMIQSNQRKFPDKNKKKRNEGDIAFNLVFKQGKFLNDPKILKNFIAFFNIRELFIIMEIDTHIFKAVIDSEVFKKYLLIRNDFVIKTDDFYVNKKNKLKNLPIVKDKPSKVVSFALNEKELNENEKQGQQKFDLKLPNIDFQKLKIKYLMNNNCQLIKKYIKTYSLSNSESRTIFNGIIEFLIIKEKGIPLENDEPKRFSFQFNKILNCLNYYVDSLMNLDYSNIIKLDLSNVGISSINIMKKLSFIFKRYSKSLRILSLANNGIDDKCAKILFPGLENNNALEILNLSYNEIGEDGLGINFFCKNKSLHTLSFHHNLLGPNGMDYLFNYFISNKKMNLKSLDIGYNGITKEGTEYISNYIKDNESLITMNIEGNYLCNEGIKIICESISQKNAKNTISFLDLQNNNITNKGCQHISNMLKESPFINGISLRNNLLYNDGVNKIISSISDENSNLVSLDLTDTKIDEKTMRTISEIINKDFVLQKLILSYNDFSTAGNYINNLLSKESNLKYLDLSFCNITTQFNAIFQGLGKNQNLKFINFTGNYIPMKKEILNEIGKVFSDNIYLKNFILNECNIDDIGMNYINKNLENNHSLMTLSLNHNFITKKSISGLENAIIKNGIIKHVYLYENEELNFKMINQIEKALKNNIKIDIIKKKLEIENDKIET